jgi:glycosyltransferase involved in cell wall biosynthesis
MRVAFTLIGGNSWTGGVNYLETLLSVLSEYPECNVEPVLFSGLDADQAVLARLAPYLVQPPILNRVWDDNKLIRLKRLIYGFGLQRDYLVEREFNQAEIEMVFQHGAWYGCRFSIPTLAWIADFQHRRLPKMFSKLNYYWRDVGYWALSHCATQIMVSSQDARQDCENFYPNSIGKVHAVPFVVKANTELSLNELQQILSVHGLPEKFFFMPNQFWKHKNHINVIEGLNRIKQSGGDIVIAVTGNAIDGRNSTHPQKVLDLVRDYELEDRFIFLGMIPFYHILPLMRLSAGVVNPSFFEGWSTTVEEAKAVGAPLILSNLPIHREQSEGKAIFFEASEPENIAKILEESWSMLIAGPRMNDEYAAIKKNKAQRHRFAMNFGALVALSVGKSTL